MKLPKKILAKTRRFPANSTPVPQSLSWDSGLVWDSLAPGIAWDGFVPTNPTNRPMATDNRISIVITSAQKTAIANAITALKDATKDILIELDPEDKQALPKIADKTLAFDEKCKAYMTSRPDLIPTYVDMTEMAKDRTAIDDLLPCLRELQPICSAFEDTVTLLYSDVYGGDLGFMQNTKQAAKRGVQGAQTIYDDLKERFPGRPKAGGNGGNPPTPPANG